MVKDIDVTAINSKSPYVVTKIESSFTFKFITDSGVIYKIELEKDNLLQTGETYQLSITNYNNIKSPRDSKLRETIIAILIEFFRANNNVLLYICDTGDEKQSMRSRLFAYWFESSAFRGGLTTSSEIVIDELGVKNYATIIMRSDHPQLAEILEEFHQTAELLREKPNNA